MTARWMNDDDVGRQLDQLLCKSSDAADIAARPTVIDPKITAIGPPQLRQSLPERRDQALGFQIVLRKVQEHAEAPHPRGLLRAHGERHRDRHAADHNDEFASPHPANSTTRAISRRWSQTSICGRIPAVQAANRRRRDELAMSEDTRLPFRSEE